MLTANVFTQYQVVTEREDVRDVIRLCNSSCFGLSAPLGLTNMAGEYAFLLLALKQDARIEVAWLRDLPAPLAGDKVRVMVRHDVDHDLLAAVEMSRLEAALGIPASYYVLHTSPYYYGHFDNSGVFHRYTGAAELYRRIQQNGAEVGLHLDALGVYQQGVDGAEAMCAELDWLRSEGLDIRGSVSHNSARYYGAENFEIFRERKILAAESIPIGGRPVPLGILSERDLGLEYEGNHARPNHDSTPEQLERYFSDLFEMALERKKEDLRLYLHENAHMRCGQDYTLWVYGQDRWVLASTDPDGPYRFDASTRDAVAFLRGIPGGKRVVLHVHPCYYGFRSSPEQDPAGWDQSALGMFSPGVLVSELITLRSLIADDVFGANGFSGKVRHLHEELRALHTKLQELDGKLSSLDSSAEALADRMSCLTVIMSRLTVILRRARKTRVGELIARLRRAIL